MDQYSGVVEVRTGTRMPYFEQGDPMGVPLVLVHAVGDSQQIFQGVLAHLPAPIHTFAPTMRGHGDASRLRSGYRSSDFAADLAAFRDAVQIDAAILAGGSSGGLIKPK